MNPWMIIFTLLNSTFLQSGYLDGRPQGNVRRKQESHETRHWPRLAVVAADATGREIGIGVIPQGKNKRVGRPRFSRFSAGSELPGFPALAFPMVQDEIDDPQFVGVSGDRRICVAI